MLVSVDASVATGVTRSVTGSGTNATNTAIFQTPGGQIQTTQTASAAVLHNGQQNVQQLDYKVTGSTDPAVPIAGGPVAHLANFAPVNALTYTDYGPWSIDASTTSAAPAYLGALGGGKPGVSATAASAMPTTGNATFTGGAAGYASQPDLPAGGPKTGTFYGAASITANFANGSVSGSISGINVYGLGVTNTKLLGTMNDIGLSGSISGSSVSGSATAMTNAGTAVDTTGAAGSLNGAFFGPTAQELAGTFTLSGGTHNVLVIGSFGAKQGAIPSDRRLKTAIRAEGWLAGGLRLYSWRYLGGRHRFKGVIAQDLLADSRFADAVEVGGDGLLRVDYDKLGYSPADIAAMRAEGEAAIISYHSAAR